MPASAGHGGLDLAAVPCNNYDNYSSRLIAAVYAPYDGSMVINLLANEDEVAGTIDTNGLMYCQSPGRRR